MDLPREIRDMIYSFCLLPRKKDCEWFSAKIKTYDEENCVESIYLMSLSLPIGLLLVDRQTHRELIDAFAKASTLKVWMVPCKSLEPRPSHYVPNSRIIRLTQACFVYVHTELFYRQWRQSNRLDDRKSRLGNIEEFYSYPAQIPFLKLLLPSINLVLCKLLEETIRLKVLYLQFARDVLYTATWKEIRNESCLNDILHIKALRQVVIWNARTYSLKARWESERPELLCWGETEPEYLHPKSIESPPTLRNFENQLGQ